MMTYADKCYECGRFISEGKTGSVVANGVGVCYDCIANEDYEAAHRG